MKILVNFQIFRNFENFLKFSKFSEIFNFQKLIQNLLFRKPNETTPPPSKIPRPAMPPLPPVAPPMLMPGMAAMQQFQAAGGLIRMPAMGMRPFMPPFGLFKVF